MEDKLFDLQKQIETLRKQRDELFSEERAVAIKDINAKIKTFAIKVRDLNFGDSSKSTTTSSGRAKVAVKYRLDNDSWTGRGRKPKWVESHLAKGGTLEDILVK